jgi:hypothetical protein
LWLLSSEQAFFVNFKSTNQNFSPFGYFRVSRPKFFAFKPSKLICRGKFMLLTKIVPPLL